MGTHQTGILLEARLSKSIPGRQLLQEVSCRLRGWERVALVGASGAGKTLLLRALALLEPGVHGQVRWQGQPVAEERIPLFRSQVMYLPQQSLLICGTVWDNLQLPLRFGVHRQRQFSQEEALELLRPFGFQQRFLRQQALQLSGGEGQVVALVRACLLQPQVLLLDEPTASMDPQAAQAAVELVQRWWEQEPENRAYIWVTHNVQLAQRVGSRRWRMSSGRLQEESPQQDLPA